MLLRKLSNYSHKNRLYQAFRELGCVVHTVFLRQFLSDEKLREVIQSTITFVKVGNYNITGSIPTSLATSDGHALARPGARPPRINAP